MPCPHGIGGCSSICHLRSISPFRQRSDKTFIVGGLDLGTATYSTQIDVPLDATGTCTGCCSLSLLRSPWAWAVVVGAVST
jgi:hypothetical protein